MVPIIQFLIILQHMYKISQNLKKLAFFNEHVLVDMVSYASSDIY